MGDITYRTAADGGIFTERFSDEFQTLSDIGEDTIYVDEEKRLAINEEVYTDENLAKLGLDKSKLVEKKGVEVGNIFPLETKYTDALDVYYTDEKGNKQSIIMGCYGIGISRLMGVVAEHFSDDKGLVWPDNIAPFKIYMVQIGEVNDEAQKLHDQLTAAGHSVLWDDRDARPGEKFADSELMGIPHRIVISPKLVEQGKIEYKSRKDSDSDLLTIDELLAKLN